MSDLIGQTLLNRYILRDLVGSGGMSDVYASWDNLRSVKLAIKVLRRELAENPRFIQMFEREANLLSELNHPNIVRLYEFKRQGDILFIVMDWIDGINLRQEISARRGPFKLGEVAAILEPITAALHFAHQNKIYHCDVKPANILVHVDGRILLTDFGVARYAAEDGGAGTPPYMAPEQFLGEGIDERTDVYSLGMTLYEMLTDGELPFRGTNPESVGSTPKERIAWEHIHSPIPSLKAYNPNISPKTEAVILKALEKNKSKRYPNTLRLKEAFDEAHSSSQDVVKFQPSKPKSTNVIEKTIILPRISIPKIRVKFEKPWAEARRTARPSSRRQRKTFRGGPRLLGRRGEMARQDLSIPEGHFSIGRGVNNQLRLQERSVSRSHAKIIRTRRGTYIRDEHSSLGTFVNGRRITGPTKLKNRDVIQIGYANEFEYRER